MLELALHYALFAQVPLRGPNRSLHRDPLNLTVLWLVLADFWRIGLACVAVLPCVAARGGETGAFLVQCYVCLVVSSALDPEILLEGNEKARRCPVWVGLAEAFLSIPHILLLACCATLLLLAFLFLDLLHFCCQIGFIFVTEEHGEVLVGLRIALLREIELLFVARGIAEAQVMWNSALTGARNHGERGAQLAIKIVFQADDHYRFLVWLIIYSSFLLSLIYITL